ncbi:hypothetical protein EDB81DRAFT_707450 [Dactylonectria macrodidyma]|uniref:Uncharacterized protein n=1 Tax=Dactylonectria macrodidyma TaxID=307937 RepID=A0A9P9FUL8_9HYPO|nr:hypothetical protein EDB81DRAFT_707450 [Dactylonectria macrodidyma]
MMASVVRSNLSKRLSLFSVILVAFIPYSHAHQWFSQVSCPTKIDALIPYGSPFDTTHAVHKTMKRCRNVTELSIQRVLLGCTDVFVRFNLPFALDGSDRYLSAPRVLRLDGYEFDDVEWQSIAPRHLSWAEEDGSWPTSTSSNPIVTWALDRYYRARMFVDWVQAQWNPAEHWYGVSGRAEAWYRWRHVAKTQRSKDNMALWLDAMDFSHVDTLSVRRYRSPITKPNGTAFFHRLPKELTSLKSLTIGGRWDDEKTGSYMQEDETSRPPRALDFILALPAESLTSLAWSGSGTCDNAVFEAVLRHHGVSLKQIEWTSSEIDHYPRPIFSTSQLRSLRNRTPELTDLAIDLTRENNDWPYEKLAALAESVPNLANLTIYLNLGVEQTKNQTAIVDRTDFPYPEIYPLAQPLLTIEAGRKMFNFLYKSQPNSKLVTVTFREGDWRSPYPRGWHRNESWMTNLQTWVSCSILGPDGIRVEDGEPSCRADRYNDRLHRSWSEDIARNK